MHLAWWWKCDKLRCARLPENKVGHQQVTVPASLQAIPSIGGLSHSVSISYLPSDE